MWWGNQKRYGPELEPWRHLCQLQKVHRAAQQQRSEEEQKEAEEALLGLAQGGEGECGEGGEEDALKVFKTISPSRTNCDIFLMWL